MKKVEVFAPAKINLTLHVTGQRQDGYHLIDSLVTFGPMGDRLVVTAGPALSLTVEGPEAEGVPADTDNLALRAAALVADDGAALTLTKNLPAASGIGGGSADAAAAYRGMLALKSADGEAENHTFAHHARKLQTLGADVPMCFAARPLRARGIGDRIDFVDLPPLPAVLVNPRVPLSTPEVFAALEQKDNPPMPEHLPDFSDASALISWLSGMRNDLQAAACWLRPQIAEVLNALERQAGCGLARMSGSGATCFGLFEDRQRAEEAARRLAEARPGWWVSSGELGSQHDAVLPRVS